MIILNWLGLVEIAIIIAIKVIIAIIITLIVLCLADKSLVGLA